MSNRTTGNVSVSVLAGHIRTTSQPPNPVVGQQVSMGDDLYFSIRPEIARQWIDTLTPIAEGK